MCYFCKFIGESTDTLIFHTLKGILLQTSKSIHLKRVENYI